MVSTPVAAPAGRVAIEVDKRVLEVGKVVMTGQKVAVAGKEGESFMKYTNTFAHRCV